MRVFFILVHNRQTGACTRDSGLLFSDRPFPGVASGARLSQRGADHAHQHQHPHHPRAGVLLRPAARRELAAQNAVADAVAAAVRGVACGWEDRMVPGKEGGEKSGL